MENNKTPKIRFKGFTDPWEQRKLEDILERRIEQRQQSEEYPRLAFASGQGVIPLSERKTNNREQLTKDEFTKKYLVTELDDIVYNPANVKYGAIDRNKCGKGLISPIYVTFTTTEEPGFIERIVTSHIFQQRALRFEEGTVTKRQSVNPEDLVTLDILVAPQRDEQKKISAYFDGLDHLITLHQRKYNKLLNVKKSMLEKMFPKNGSNIPEIRFKGFTDPWEQRKLGELVTYRNGSGHEEKQSDSGKYELINLNSISIDGGLKSSGKFIDEETETLLKDDLVMVLSDVGHGDLLGRVAIIPENNRFVLNQRVALLRNNSFVDIKYLFAYINAHQIYFKKQGAGSSQLNISRGSVENFEVQLPHKDEQEKIGKCLSSIDNLITLHQRELEKLQNIKKSMLEKMFV